MVEAKADLQRRWQREGRVEEVTAFRERVREKLRGEGVRRHDAAQQAWEQAATEFPPLEAANDTPPDPEENEKPGEELAGASPDPATQTVVDWNRDLQWSYHNLDVTVKPADAPSAGAWSLRLWGRSNRAKFFDMVQREFKDKPAHASAPELDSDDHDGIEEIREYLRKYGSQRTVRQAACPYCHHELTVSEQGSELCLMAPEPDVSN